jgi:serine/threonine protein kinase
MRRVKKNAIFSRGQIDGQVRAQAEEHLLTTQEVPATPVRIEAAEQGQVWLRTLAEAVRDEGRSALDRQASFGHVLDDVARALHQRLGDRGDEEQQRSWLQEAVQLPMVEMRRAAERISSAVAGKLSSVLRSQLTAYLAQASAAIRQYLRRPSDPDGLRVPADLPLQTPCDLLPLLPPRPALYRPGDRPDGLEQWRLVDLLALGEVGEVWKAVPARGEGSPVVLKFWPENLARNEPFCRDANEVIQALEDEPMPGVVFLREVYPDRNPVCLKVELVEGGNLAGLVRKWSRARSTVHYEQTARLMLGLAQVVAWAHGRRRPLIHGDLKPAHLLLQPVEHLCAEAPEGPVLLRVLDYGLGRTAMQRALTQARQGLPAGLAQMQARRGSHSLLYASPQLLQGARPGPADDVYAMGVIAYQMLRADTTLGLSADWPEQLARLRAPRPLVQLVQACLAEQPEQRIRSETLVQELTQALAPRVLATVLTGPVNGGARDPQAERIRQALQGIHRLHDRARELEARHDYLGAIDVLEAVPERLRAADLYDSLCRRRDRVQQLDREITRALRARSYDGLRPKVEELFRLKPMRSELRQLLDDWPDS